MQHRKRPFSISKRLLSFKYAFNGLWVMFRYEHNAWIHLVVAVIVIGFGKLVHLTSPEWIIITLAIGLVFIAELFNTAIEYLCNAVAKEDHPIIKKTKDVSAAAVLVSAITSAIIGLIIFIPKLILLFQF